MECNWCGERMRLEWPATLIFDYAPASPEIRHLMYYARQHPRARVWACYGCGNVAPATV